MADTPRTPREGETREKTTRRRGWQRPSMLPTPDASEGWNYRYIRTATLGQSDATNVSSKFREGWEPVAASEHPELQITSDVDSRFKDSVEVGNLLLCRAPSEMVEERTAYYSQQTRRQLESVDQNYMRENDPRMPLLKTEARTEVTFGKGRK